MAQWRLNEQMYGPGGGEYVDDNGQVTPDPWGVLQVNAPTPGAGAPPMPDMSGGGLGPAPAGLAEFVNTNPAGPPAPAGAHADPARGPDPAMDPGVPTADLIPNLVPGHADRAGGAPQIPQLTPGGADQLQTTTSTTTEKGSTGLSDEAQARAGANITAAQGANSRAVDATAAAGTLQANQAQARSQMLLTDAAKNIEKIATEQAVNDHIQNEVNRKMVAGAEWRPDRTELFHGDHGVAFGLSAAVAAMAGAWMQGRGLTGQNPYLPTIIKMIDDNATDQVRQNSSAMQYLRERKGDLKAAQLELKQKQLHYAQQRLDGLALKDTSDLLRAGVEKTREEMLAQNAKWEQEKRQALERTESKKVTSTLTRAPRPGANNTAAMAAGGQLRQLDRIIGDLEEAEKSGALASVVGWQDRIGANGFQEFFGGLPPEQQKALNAIRELEIINRADWKSEPNGQAVQARLAGIGIPRNDRDIPVSMQRLRAMRADKALGLAGAAVSGPDPTTDAF